MRKKSRAQLAALGVCFYKKTDSMRSVAHESRKLKYARPIGQYVDILRGFCLAYYSLI